MYQDEKMNLPLWGIEKAIISCANLMKDISCWTREQVKSFKWTERQEESSRTVNDTENEKKSHTEKY